MKKGQNNIQGVNKNTLQKTCVVYTRTAAQIKAEVGNSLKNQENTCRELATQNDIKVVAVFSDGGVSGTCTSRRGLEQMINFLKQMNMENKPISFVLVSDMSRLSRSLLDSSDIEQKLKSCGARALWTDRAKRFIN